MKLTAKEACIKAHALRKELGCSLSEAFKMVYSNQDTNTKKGFFRKDIDRIFTETVNKYLKKGFIFSTDTMGGSQGEIAKVDLIKDGKIIRILLESDCNHSLLGGDCYNRLNLVIGEAEVSKIYGGTLWSTDLKIIEKKAFVDVGHGKFFVSEDQLPEIADRKLVRVALKSDDWKELTAEQFDRYAPILLRFVRRGKGCKGIKRSDIYSIMTRVGADKAYYSVIINRNGRFSYYTIKAYI